MGFGEQKAGVRLYSRQLNGKGYYVRLDSLADQGLASEEIYDDQRSGYQIDFWQVIRRRLWVIALVVIMIQGFAVTFTWLQTPLYTTSIKMLVDAGNTKYADSPYTVQGLVDITTTLAELVATRPVAEDVAQRLGPPTSADSILRNLIATQVEDTQLIEISYTDPNPQEAQRVANTVGTVFSEHVANGDLGGGGGTTHVVEKATLPTSPTSPNPLRNIALALAAGLMLGVTLALLLDYVDNNWRSPEEVERVAGVPNLGIIPTFYIPKDQRKGV